MDKNFERFKIYKSSTNKVAMSAYLDSFGIDKVRIELANYEPYNSISYYLDFPVIFRLANDINSGKLNHDLAQGQVLLGMGGSKSSKVYNGKPEAKTLTIAKSGDKVFLNVTSQEGKLINNGLISGVKGSPLTRISIPLDNNTFKEFVFMCKVYIESYLSSKVPNLVNEAGREFEKYRRG